MPADIKVGYRGQCVGVVTQAAGPSGTAVGSSHMDPSAPPCAPVFTLLMRRLPLAERRRDVAVA